MSRICQCLRSCEIYNNKKIFNANLHSIHKEKHNFKEIFLKEIKKKKLLYKDVLCQVFHLNEDTAFTEIMTNKKFSL